MSGQITTNPPVLQILVNRLREPVECASLERAQLHVLDWLACAGLGVKSPSASGFVNQILTDRENQTSGKCKTVSAPRAASANERTDGRTNWWNALQINAACGNMLEMDDLDRASILHPGPVIVPAAIAVAEQVGADGRELLQAIVRGYEATIRIGRALGTPHYAFFHNTSTCGAFGAAAAAADLLRLNAEQTVWALANAGSRTGGLWQMRHEIGETKSLHNVQAAQCGVQAAMLAAQGVRGPVSLLEGPQGLFAAMAPSSLAGNVVAELDRDWLIHEVSFKPWPACRHAHSTIDAALAVRAKISDWRLVDSVIIRTYKSAIDFCDQPNPDTTLQGKFSLQHCAAVALIDGAPQFAHFEAAALQQEDVVSMRKRVRVEESAELTSAFPQHYGAYLRVTMQDGTSYEHLQRDAKGDSECPLSAREIETKAKTLLQSAGIENAPEMIAATLTLTGVTSLHTWTELWP